MSVMAGHIALPAFVRQHDPDQQAQGLTAAAHLAAYVST